MVLRSDDNFLLVETQIEKETRIGWYGWNQRSRERESVFFLAGFGLEKGRGLARCRRCGELNTLLECSPTAHLAGSGPDYRSSWWTPRK